MASLIPKLMMPALVWRMQRHRQAYEVSYRGERIIVLPEVFSPRYDRSSKVAIAWLPPLVGKTFLEVGCGSGIVSLFAARAGARLIVATDISAAAARNTKLNLDAHGIVNAFVLQADLLDAVAGKFDLVLFNPPFYDAAPRNVLERAIFDQGLDVLKRFIADVPRCLAADGQVMLGFAKGGDEGLLRRELERARLAIIETKEFGIVGLGGKYFRLRAI
ncbi:MAG: methyltransferase [Hyphomicrobiales bacterium]|nr:methyltransferase [Hyphomicrobiales bacterium]